MDILISVIILSVIVFFSYEAYLATKDTKTQN